MTADAARLWAAYLTAQVWAWRCAWCLTPGDDDQTTCAHCGRDIQTKPRKDTGT